MKFGNCIVLSKSKTKPRAKKATKLGKIVQIVEMNGEIIELNTPITVGKFLEKNSGFNLSILSKSPQYLPPSYELKKGHTYYLVPKVEKTQNLKRIKVVITKQQLQELLAKQGSVEEILLGLKVKSFCSVNNDSHSTYLKTNAKLESIPEEIE